MEFWGVEVKAGEPMKVTPDLGNVVHLSQACLGEAKKAADSVIIYGKAKDQKLVLGHLIPGQIPQLSFDLVFDEEFELSHNWKNGSVHFAGYQSVMGDEEGNSSDDYESTDSEEEEEELPVTATENGKVENAKPASTKNNAVKPESSGKLKVKIEEPKDESDEDDSASDMDGSMDSAEDDSDDDDSEGDSDEEDEDEETPTPKKPESKKRAQDSAKTPVSAKKAKIDATTPQKTDAKKGGHTDTPHPAKKGKTPGTDKSKAQTPKSAGGNFSCGTCSKSFGSDGALQSHNKAKHNAGK